MSITSASVYLGGKSYALTYNSSTGMYEATVTLTAVSSGQTGGYFNTIVDAASNSGIFASADGSTLTALRLVVNDTVGPVVIVSSPADGLLTTAESVTVSGTATDESGIRSVTVNGTSVSVGSGGAFSTSVNLSEGVNTITIVGTDGVGNTTTITRKVTRVVYGPTVTITSPEDGTITGSGTITVTGTVSDMVTTVSNVSVNGVAAVISGGTYSASISLTEGRNTITVTATNAAGLSSSASIAVTLDTAPPELTVTNPAGDIITNQAEITVTGTAYDGGSGLDTVTVNGNTVTVTDGAFSVPLTLTEGQNTITVTATDNVGYASTVTRSVLLDTQEPVITLVSPAEGWITVNRPAVRFRVEDEAGGSGLDMDTLEITVNGVKQTAGISAAGAEVTFTPVEILPEGANVITVTIRDRAGNVRGLSVTYKVDTLPPVLQLTDPIVDTIVDTPEIVFSGRATDEGAGVEYVSANGAKTEPDADGWFSITVPVEIGTNTVDVSARDRAGWESAATFTVIRLITDRTAADVERAKYLNRIMKLGTATAEEAAEWAGNPKGAYNASDLNRVGAAVALLKDTSGKFGYDLHVSARTDFTENTAQTRTEMETYLADIREVREKLPVFEEIPEAPESIRFLNYAGANDIEKILVIAARWFPKAALSWFASGEIAAGET